MAVSKPPTTATTGSDASAHAAALRRRLVFGTNVGLTIVIAAVLVVVINWISLERYARKDVASAGQYSLSDRTKKIIDKSPLKEITLTSVYTSTDKDSDRYRSRVEDLFEELESYGKGRIKTANLTDDDAKRKLVERVQAKYGGKTGAYRELITLAHTNWDALRSWMDKTSKQYQALAEQKAWIAGFTTFGQIYGSLARDRQELEAALREIDEATSGIGIPRYEEAKQKIETNNTNFKADLEAGQKALAELAKAAATLRDPNNAFTAETQKQLATAASLLQAMQDAVGKPDEQGVPDNPKEVLQAYVRELAKFTKWLETESTRVGEFAEQYPPVRGSRLWYVPMPPVRVDLPSFLSVIHHDLLQQDAFVRQEYLSEDRPLDVLQSGVRDMRASTAEMQHHLSSWGSQLQTLLATMQTVDPASQALLDEADKGTLYAEQIALLTAIADKIKALPELKLEDAAHKFEQDNIIVVEAGDEVKVVDFDSVWPRSDMGPAAPDTEDKERRVFDGDAAIAAAIMSLSRPEPFATVVLTFYEPSPEPSPMMQQMPQPRTGQLPSRALSTVRERIEQVGFAVKEWNLASGEDAPAPEKDRPNIYVILPPAESVQPNPYSRAPQDIKNFGEPELKKVRDVLEKENARALFLVGWLQPRAPRMMGMPPEPPTYGYEGLLKDDWGIDVKYAEFVIRGIPDNRTPDQYLLSIDDINYMRLNSFDEKNPIGAPLRSRRVLMTRVCPVVQMDKAPDGVKIEPILEIPREGTRSPYWAESDLQHIIRELNSPMSDGHVTKVAKSATDPPFTVMLAAENTKTKSRIVVSGGGFSLADMYLNSRVQRIGEKGQLTFDPPPKENAELFINCIDWLADKPEYIAAGPVTTPPIRSFEPGTRRTLQIIAIVWALAALGAGGIMMFVRRR